MYASQSMILAALPVLALAAPAPTGAPSSAVAAPPSSITAAPSSVDPNDSNPTVAAFLSSLITAVGFNSVAASYLASEFAKPALSEPGNQVGTATQFLDPFHAAHLTASTDGPAIFSIYEGQINSLLPSGTAREALESVVTKGQALATLNVTAPKAANATGPVTVTVTAAPACGSVDPNESNPTEAAFLSSLITAVGFNSVAASYLASEFAKPALSEPGNMVGTATQFLQPFQAAHLTASTDGPAIFSIYEGQISSLLPSGTARAALVSVVQEGQALQQNASAAPNSSGPAVTSATPTAAAAAAASQNVAGRAASSIESHAAGARQTGLGMAAGVVAGVVGIAMGL